VFYEVILPLFEVKRTVGICISTPMSEGQFYTGLEDIKVNGRRVFKSLKVGLICEKCAKENNSSLECPHKVRSEILPPWKSIVKHRAVQAMYADNKALYAQESLGVVTGFIHLFSLKIVSKIFTKNTYSI
tara:strand:- start:566 stop:955 length:390 start_codon:yes stop_codon:yes gene_type:complete